MKRITLGLSLLALAATAQANTGTISFTGQISAGNTCPITIIAPGGGTNGTVEMGEAYATDFPTTGTERNNRQFQIKIDDPTQCAGWDPTDPGAVVSFSGRHGGADSGKLFALNPDNTPATKVALGIRDKDNNLVGHGEDSGEYPIETTGASTLPFTAHYRSFDTGVTAGHANTDVTLEVKFN